MEFREVDSDILEGVLEDTEEVVLFRAERLDIPGGTIPIELSRYRRREHADAWGVGVDGVIWFLTNSMMHALVLFEMMRDHITGYMHYRAM